MQSSAKWLLTLRPSQQTRDVTLPVAAIIYTHHRHLVLLQRHGTALIISFLNSDADKMDRFTSLIKPPDNDAYYFLTDVRLRMLAPTPRTYFLQICGSQQLNIYSHFQVLSKDIFIRADYAFSVLEMIFLFNGLYKSTF